MEKLTKLQAVQLQTILEGFNDTKMLLRQEKIVIHLTYFSLEDGMKRLSNFIKENS